MAKYIVSTCSAPMEFPVYGPVNNRMVQAKVLRKIIIKGGANVIDKHTLVVPQGVVTEITEADLEELQKMEAFKRMVTRGFLAVRDTDKLELDKHGHVDGMAIKDGSAQIVDAEHASGEDSRINHASTTAGAGKDNQYLGKQSAVMNSYGRIGA